MLQPLILHVIHIIELERTSTHLIEMRRVKSSTFMLNQYCLIFCNIIFHIMFSWILEFLTLLLSILLRYLRCYFYPWRSFYWIISVAHISNELLLRFFFAKFMFLNDCYYVEKWCKNFPSFFLCSKHYYL